MHKNVVLALARNVLVAAVSLCTLTLQAASSAKVAWDASPSPNITAYTVRYGTASGSYPNSQSVGTALTATVTNLTVGTRYYFVVTARNSSGLESDASNEVSYTPSASSPTNAPPTLDAISNRTLNEDAGQQTVSLTGIGAGAGDPPQTLTISASSSNPALMPNPAVSYASPNSAGSLFLSPVANANGTATITVTVNDGQSQNNSITRSFVVMVNAVNDAPTLNTLGNLTLPVGSGQQTISLGGIGSGSANESQTLTVTATTSNPGVIPTPTISYSSPASFGTLSFTPVSGANGTATISVTVNDGQSQSNTLTRSFTVTMTGSTFYLEAESGARVSPMTIGSDPNAANGQYVYSPRNNLGNVSFAINIVQAATYWVWCRVRSPDSGKDSFFVAADGGAEEIFDANPGAGSSTWQWIKLNRQATGSARTFNWSSGSHVLTFRSRDRSTFLDALYITNDENFIPAGPPEPAAGLPTALPTVEGAPVAGAVVTGLAVTHADARNITLAWQTDKPASCLVNFRVQGTDEWLAADNDFSIEPGTDHEITLTALEPGTTYAVNVVAADFDGGISSTEAGTVTTPPVSLLSWEAENGNLAAPMLVRNDESAWNGRCISSDADLSGTALYAIEVPVTCDFRLWCRLRGPGVDFGSIAVSANAASEQIVELAESGWRWVQTHPGPLQLQSGIELIFIRSIRPGVVVDQLILCNDPLWRPGID